MEMLLCIYINDKNWTAEEREEVMDRSVKIYMETRRKIRLAAKEEPPKEKKRDQENENELKVMTRRI